MTYRGRSQQQRWRRGVRSVHRRGQEQPAAIWSGKKRPREALSSNERSVCVLAGLVSVMSGLERSGGTAADRTVFSGQVDQ
jgi:hypothetical protein